MNTNSGWWEGQRGHACNRLGRDSCMTMVRVGWSQLPASFSSIIILLAMLCT